VSESERPQPGDPGSPEQLEVAAQDDVVVDVATGEGITPAGELVTTGRGGLRQAIIVPVLAVVSALAIGALLIIFTEEALLHQWAGFFRHPAATLNASGLAVREAYGALFRGSLGSRAAISETIVAATPLVFAGLSVAIGFRAGLFNIGAEGQITTGAVAASMVGFSMGSLPGPIHLALIVIAGFLGGAAWGAIPGALKAKTGAHEVITTIMLNVVAANLALYALSTEFFRPKGRTDPIAKPVLAAFPRLFGSSYRVHAGFIVALAMAAGVAWLLNRTTVGFEFRAVGANPAAARAAGMSPTRTIVVVMALAGGLAGLAGATQLASTIPSLTPGFSSGYGFDAIAVALVGRARPSGVVAAARLFGALRAGSRQMQALTQIPIDIVVVIQALVILFIAAPALVRAIYRIRARRVAGPETFTKGWAG